MSKLSRSVLIEELNDLSNGTLFEKIDDVDKYWSESFGKYGGEKITSFPDAKKAGEIVLSDFSSKNTESALPRLKAIWNKDVAKKTSSYVIVVDGIVVKIGALSKGVKDSSFSQYLSGVSGSPSRRSCAGYTFLSTMLKNGYKVEVYHVTMDGIANVKIPTISGVVRGKIHYSSRDIEKQNLEVYKEKTNGNVPLLNFKERNVTIPMAVDKIYELVNKRIFKNKKYTDSVVNVSESVIESEKSKAKTEVCYVN